MDAEWIERSYRERTETGRRFFTREAPKIAALCAAMAERFQRKGRLLALGMGPAATDAQHVSVEFVHPVIVGKRALPALALVNDGPSLLVPDALTGLLERQLTLLTRPDDIVLAIDHGTSDDATAALADLVARAGKLGALTVWMGAGKDHPPATHSFAVEAEDPFVVQETIEVCYHIVWELVHVFFEHGAVASGGSGASSFLYPFLSESAKDMTAVLTDVERSVLQKSEDVIALREDSCDPDALLGAAEAVRTRLAAKGKVLAFGNGGSATDAQDLVTDLITPPPPLTPRPGLSLTNDEAVVLAIANDIGFENVFSRQVIAHGSDTDVAVAISTSGGSRNVIKAVEQARAQGLLTVGLCGYGGGRVAELCDHTLIVSGDHVPRIQEAQAAQYHVLRRLLG